MQKYTPFVTTISVVAVQCNICSITTEGNPVPVEPQEQNKSEVLCTPPLVKTELQDIPYYLRCSPKCFQEDWISDRDQTAMEVMIYITAIFSLFSVLITFITWAKVAEL
jgi:hypothetical protein